MRPHPFGLHERPAAVPRGDKLRQRRHELDRSGWLCHAPGRQIGGCGAAARPRHRSEFDVALFAGKRKPCVGRRRPSQIRGGGESAAQASASSTLTPPRAWQTWLLPRAWQTWLLQWQRFYSESVPIGRNVGTALAFDDIDQPSRLQAITRRSTWGTTSRTTIGCKRLAGIA